MSSAKEQRVALDIKKIFVHGIILKSQEGKANFTGREGTIIEVQSSLTFTQHSNCYFLQFIQV